MKTYAIVVFAATTQATGNIFLSKGMKQIASSGLMGYEHWVSLLPRFIASPALWLGTAFLILSFLLFATALTWEDLSFVMPAISIEVIMNVAFASYFLNEHVSPTRWMGTLLISAGVILVFRSQRRAQKRGLDLKMKGILEGGDR